MAGVNFLYRWPFSLATCVVASVYGQLFVVGLGTLYVFYFTELIRVSDHFIKKKKKGNILYLDILYLVGREKRMERDRSRNITIYSLKSPPLKLNISQAL